MTIDKIVAVLLPLPRLFPLNYYIPDNLELKRGNLVIVPFKNKELVGIVWEFIEHFQNTKKLTLKYIKNKIFPEIILKPEILLLIKKASQYYLSDLGSIASLVLPLKNENFTSITPPNNQPSCFNLSTLSSKQHQILETIQQLSKPIVIKGITGSGKTEIYFHLIAHYLNNQKQCLVMLPEISLSTQIISRFIHRFGFHPIIWHSEINKAKKNIAFQNIINGNPVVVIGTRSSLFLPYKNLALIVVDEEHDGSYKQEDNILYHARDMAILRSHLENAKILLCSATPSIETMYNVHCKKYQLLELEERYNNSNLPQVEIIDMRSQQLLNNHWISLPLAQAMYNNLQNNEQVLLFLNRRGYAPLLICKACGYRADCKFCSSSLVIHKVSKKLECHHCGYVSQVPSHCPDCMQKDSLRPYGPGIERIAEEAQLLFPTSRIALISKDQTKKKSAASKILEEMENGKIDILIGTQLITKGYHFPNLTLVGVIDADLSMQAVDLKAAEKTFQLLYQVGGRAGRENKLGHLLLQTYQPDNIIYDSIKNYKINEFFDYELNNRGASNMPPFSKMAAIILSSKIEERVADIAKYLVQIAPTNNNVKILGPARALLTKLAGKYRYRILVIVNKNFPLQKYLTAWLDDIKIPSSVYVKIDIDPHSFS